MATLDPINFLSIPVDIRLLIYDRLASFRPDDIASVAYGRSKFASSSAVTERNRRLLASLAITRVSRQIRDEATQTMYKDLDCVVWNSKLGTTDNTHNWLKSLDPQAVACFRKLKLYFPDCSAAACHFVIFAAGINMRVAEVSNCFACTSSSCLSRNYERRSEKRMQLDNLIKDLPLVENVNRRELTVEALAAMLEVMEYKEDDDLADDCELEEMVKRRVWGGPRNAYDFRGQ